ncbi:MAG: hypothetical protein ACNA7F_13000 [Roseovarius sp.]
MRARAFGQAVLVLAGDFTGAAADAIDVVVDETHLHLGHDGFVDLALAF